MRFSGSLMLTALGVVVAAATWFSGLYEKNFYLTGHLGYDSAGLECSATECKLGVGLRNDGYVVDEDVTFELPSGLKPKKVYVSSAHESFVKGGVTVLKLGLVHPGAYKYVLVIYPPASKLDEFELQNLDIYSKTRLATYDGPRDKLFDLSVPWWVKYPSIACITYLVGLLLYLLVESPARRRRRLIKELVSAEKWHRWSKARYQRKIAAIDASLKTSTDRPVPEEV